MFRILTRKGHLPTPCEQGFSNVPARGYSKSAGSPGATAPLPRLPPIPVVKPAKTSSKPQFTQGGLTALLAHGHVWQIATTVSTSLTFLRSRAPSCIGSAGAEQRGRTRRTLSQIQRQVAAGFQPHRCEPEYEEVLYFMLLADVPAALRQLHLASPATVGTPRNRNSTNTFSRPGPRLLGASNAAPCVRSGSQLKSARADETSNASSSGQPSTMVGDG
jgi:hypothetical protein